VREAAHGAVANGDQEALGRYRGMGQHGYDGLLQIHAGQVQRLELARHGLHIAVHLGRLAKSTFIGM